MLSQTSTSTGLHYDQTHQAVNIPQSTQETQQAESITGENHGNTATGQPTGEPTEDPPLIRWARAYQEHGLFIFPLKHQSKQPAKTGWQDTPQVDPVDMFQPGEEIGIQTGDVSGRLIVVDWDILEKSLVPKNDVSAKYNNWLDTYVDYLDTVTTKSRKGHHYYFRLDSDTPYPQGHKFYIDGVECGDLQGQGRYVVAPPSTHESGDCQYEWVISPEEMPIKVIKSIEDIGLSTIVSELLSFNDYSPQETEIYDIEAYLKKTIDNVAERISKVQPGERNHVISSGVYSLARLCPHHISKQDIIDQILCLAETKYEKSELKELQSFFQASIKAGMSRPKFLKIKDTSGSGGSENKSGMLVKNTLPERVKNKLRQHYQFRYNVVRGLYEFRENGQPKYENMTDRDFNSIWTFLSKYYFHKLPEAVLRKIIESDFADEYNPIADYIKELPPWNGIDYINQLSQLVNTTNDNASQWQLYLKRWLIASVATWTGKSVNHSCLILVGPQGIGKSTFVNKLCPLSDYIYVGQVYPNNKDSKFKAVENMIINLDELESSTREDWSFIKSLLTLQSIKERRSYGRRDELFPRRASFAGSANNKQLLGDLTGSRRWLCVQVDKVDYMGITPELVKGVYSQALHLLNQGEKYWFDGAEIDTIHAQNETFYQPVPEEEVFLQLYRKPDYSKGETGELKTTSEIIKELTAHNNAVKYNVKKTGQVLIKEGFIRKRRYPDKVWTYEVVYIGPNTYEPGCLG